MSWEDGEKPKAWTRREWVKLSMTLGAVGAVGALGGLSAGDFLPPPVKFNGEVREGIFFTKFPTPQWWNSRDGTQVKVTDFQEWQGATGVWRGLYQNNQLIPGTGFPCMVIRVPYDAPEFAYPSPSALATNGIGPAPAGFSYYYQDDATKTRIIVFYDRCVHLCCYPGWHVVTNPPPGRDYVVPPPTYDVYHEDPIYCICHGSQYDPLLLTVNFNPHSNVNYIGAERVHGPAPRALVVIPVKDVGGALVGGMPDPRWYVYC